MYPPYRLKKKFKSYQDKLSLDGICENINSLWYLKDKIDLISDKGWEKLCLNKNPQAIFLLENNISKLSNQCWDILGSKHSHSDLFILVENNISLLPSHTWVHIASNPNPRAILLLKRNLDKLNTQGLKNLIQNEQAIDIIRDNFFIIENNNYWEYLCSHTKGIDLIIKNKKIKYLNNNCWKMILPSFFHYQIILDNLEKFTIKEKMLEYICLNSHPEIIQLISRSLPLINKLKNSIICWENICLNDGAVSIINDNFNFLYEQGLLVFISQNKQASQILNDNIDIIIQFKNLKFIIPSLVSNCQQNKSLLEQIFTHPCKKEYGWDIWIYLCRCENLIKLIQDNFEYIMKYKHSLYDLCGNKEAIELIEGFLPVLENEWYILSENSSIFEPDYSFLSNNIQMFQEELISTVYHPQKMIYFLEKYNYDIGDEDYLEKDS